MADSAPTPASLDVDADLLSVAELNDRIATHLDAADALDDVWCRGEVSDCHETDVAVYFSLTSEDASIDCVLWQNRYDTLDITLEDGLEVILQGSVDFYREQGRLNIKPWRIHPVGEGDRYAALEQLRRDLEDRGWFDDARKQSLPAYPTCVGVVTSRDGDARYDIQDAIHERSPGVDITLCHASVQGEHAPGDLVAGLERLDADPDVDVIVIGRGGGSDDALMAFNTEPVAEAIVHASTPVVSAVGHREDETIADAVADESAITPTAAGTAVVPDVQDTREHLADLDRALEDAYTAFARDRLHELRTTAATAYQSFAQTRIDELERELTAAYTDFKHEQEKRAAIEDAQTDATRTIRRYQALVALLVLVVLGLFVWVILL